MLIPARWSTLDIKKLSRIPQSGGRRIQAGFADTRSDPRRGPLLGFDFLHVAVDNHSHCVSYAETLPNERGATATAFLFRALAHFKCQGIAVERILTITRIATWVASPPVRLRPRASR